MSAVLISLGALYAAGMLMGWGFSGRQARRLAERRTVMGDAAAATIQQLEADLSRSVCLNVWADQPCSFDIDGPCGRCGPGAREAVQTLLSIHEPGAAKAAAHQLRSFRRD